jgi:MFS family permease
VIGKKGTRATVSLAILAVSIVTFIMGFTMAAVGLLVLRLLLGLAEGPVPVGMTSTVNSWFPPREKGTATGLYIASTQFAPTIGPTIAIAIGSRVTWSFWRSPQGTLPPEPSSEPSPFWSLTDSFQTAPAGCPRRAALAGALC